MTVTTVSEADVSIDSETTLEYIGVEFEYPVADDEDMVPCSYANRSSDLRNSQRGDWVLDEPDIPTGRMTGDHVGAEITSAPMQLHTTQPEVWYFRTIQKATEHGYPFAACGYGETNFGLHLNLSPLSERKARFIYELCQEPWARIMFCSSVTASSADPWRWGGVSSSGLRGERPFEQSVVIRSCRDSQADYDESAGNYYEWRLPEPCLPGHFGLYMNFLRTLDIEGTEAAYDYAYDLVHDKDERLTPIQQYTYFRDNVDGWLETATDPDQARIMPETVEYFVELMGDA